MVDYDRIKAVFHQYFDCDDVIIIHKDGEISTKGYVSHKKKATQLPVTFHEVDGFDVGGMGLTSLAGSPKFVYTEFLCIENQLKTLEGGPVSVGGAYLCGFNNLTSLKGAPKKVLGHMSCPRNPLVSLEGIPGEGLGGLVLEYNRTLPLLRALVAKQIQFVHHKDEPEPPQKLQEIMSKYAGQGKRAMFDCQKELEDAGFSENARW